MEKTILLIKKSLNFLLNILFPLRCVGCKTLDDILCDNCVNKLHLAERETESNIISMYDYRDPVVKDAIWKLKYHKNPYLGQKFGQLLYNELIEEISTLQIFSQGCPIYVIPVPISRERRNTRGYNQSEIIARSFSESGISNIFQIKTNIVYKKSNTLPQAKITNRNERLQNIKGTFELNKSESVKGKTVIIIDDVTTTGGTIMEIMKILKKGGVKKVVGFTIAH